MYKTKVQVNLSSFIRFPWFLYNIIAPITLVQSVGTVSSVIILPSPFIGLGVFYFNKFYKLSRYGLSRLLGSDGLKFINRALSRIAVASYLPPSSVSVHLEVLYAEGSLLINFSLSLIISISTNLDRFINYISCEVALWGY